MVGETMYTQKDKLKRINLLKKETTEGKKLARKLLIKVSMNSSQNRNKVKKEVDHSVMQFKEMESIAEDLKAYSPSELLISNLDNYIENVRGMKNQLKKYLVKLN